VLVTMTDDGKTRVDAAITRLVDAEAELLGSPAAIGNASPACCASCR
jgi:hypothetical protein